MYLPLTHCCLLVPSTDATGFMNLHLQNGDWMPHATCILGPRDEPAPRILTTLKLLAELLLSPLAGRKRGKMVAGRFAQGPACVISLIPQSNFLRSVLSLILPY